MPHTVIFRSEFWANFLESAQPHHTRRLLSKRREGMRRQHQAPDVHQPTSPGSKMQYETPPAQWRGKRNFCNAVAALYAITAIAFCRLTFLTLNEEQKKQGIVRTDVHIKISANHNENEAQTQHFPFCVHYGKENCSSCGMEMYIVTVICCGISADTLWKKHSEERTRY